MCGAGLGSATTPERLAPAVLIACLACTASEAPPSGWVELSVGPPHFTLHVPDGTRVVPGRGADSAVGTLEGPGFSLRFDYGLYSNPLEDVDGAQVQELQIGGETARLVTRRDAAAGRFAGVHFPHLGDTPIGPLRLTVSARPADDALLALVERIYRSIRFPEA